MGSHGTWQAASAVFFWPENLLLPTLRGPTSAQNTTARFATTAFRALAQRLRGNLTLSPAQARAQARTYLQELTVELGAALPAAVRFPTFEITELVRATTWSSAATRCSAPAPRPRPHPTCSRTSHRLPPRRSGSPRCFRLPTAGAAALQLERSGQHLAALAWRRTVFAHDFSAEDNQRKIYRGLVLQADIPTQVALQPADLAARRPAQPARHRGHPGRMRTPGSCC